MRVVRLHRLNSPPISLSMFFSFDGIDGVGKSTQMELFCEWLRGEGRQVTFCRDPGSTPLGERIREILLASDPDVAIDRRAEMLLYMAARAQLVDQVIRPALERSEVVVSDRYLLANIVYQGHAGGLDPEVVRQVGEVAIDGVRPDCVFLLDMPVDAADRRLERPLDRMEQQGASFRHRLRSGYLLEAERPGSVIQVIDAGGSIDQVQQAIRQHAKRLLAG
jgi:dTMP kinase